MAGRRRGPLPRREEPRGRVRGLGAPGPAGSRGGSGRPWVNPALPRLGSPRSVRAAGAVRAWSECGACVVRSSLSCFPDPGWGVGSCRRVGAVAAGCRTWLSSVKCLRCLLFKGTLRDRGAWRSVCGSGVRGDAGHALFPSSNS